MERGIDISRIVSVEEITIDETYDLTVEGNHNYYLDCGFDVLVHNSAKTYDAIHLIYTFCEHNKKKPIHISVYRETLVKCRDTTLKDFKECFSIMGLEKDKDYILTGDVNGRPIINLFGSIIEFKGYPESGKEAGRSDIVYINEILESNGKDVIMGIYQRCELLFIADANPAVTDHWVFQQDKQFNTFMTKTTYLDNRHLPESLAAEYESWCPWDFRDSHIETIDGFKVRIWDKPECGANEKYDENKHRRPNLINEERGTIDKFRWLVYGEGIRAAREGAIFQDAKWTDEFPDSGFDEVVLSCDFGFVQDSSTLVRTGVKRKTMEATIECMACQPTKTPEITFDLFEPCLLKELERRRKEGIYSDELWICCESQDKFAGTDWVISLNEIAAKKGYNWNFFKISKKSILAGVSIMLRFKLTLVRMDKRNPNKDRFVLEQQNYIYKIHPTTQKPTNEPDPDSKYCDIWDAARYGFQNNFAHLTKENN